VKCPLVYDAEAGPDVIAEMQVMKDEIEEVNAKAKESVAMDSDVEEVSKRLVRSKTRMPVSRNLRTTMTRCGLTKTTTTR
jgi:hypothetical protein